MDDQQKENMYSREMLEEMQLKKHMKEGFRNQIIDVVAASFILFSMRNSITDSKKYISTLIDNIHLVFKNALGETKPLNTKEEDESFMYKFLESVAVEYKSELFDIMEHTLKTTGSDDFYKQCSCEKDKIN